MIAYKPFLLCPFSQRPPAIPLEYPWIAQVCEESEASGLRAKKWTVVSQEDYDALIEELQPLYDAWVVTAQRLQVEGIVAAARDFGMRVMINFAAENILLGITQDGKTGEVITKLASVMTALQAGSLYEAITQLRAVPSENYDDKYVTAARLLTAVNKIETYLNLPLSETL